MSDESIGASPRRILIKYTNPQEPDEIIEIPEDWKITFGPWSPRERSRAMTQNMVEAKPGWILRVYESKEKQRAVFTNVESFRDLSIPLFRGKITVVPMKMDEVTEDTKADYDIVTVTADQEF